MIKNKFETIHEGRGSKAHKDYLKEKIKKDLKRLEVYNRLKKMSLKEINDRAEVLLKQAKKKGLIDDIALELEIIQEILTGIIQNKKVTNGKKKEEKTEKD